MKIMPWRLDEPWNRTQRFVAYCIISAPFVLLILVLVGALAYARNTLPACPGTNPTIYSNECAVLATPGSTISSTGEVFHCGDDYELVLRASGYACAKSSEIKPATK